MKKRRRFTMVVLITTLIVVVALTVLPRRDPGLYRVTVLPSLGGGLTMPLAISDTGKVAGFARAKDGTHHLFFWDHQNGMRDLGPMRICHCDINNAGQIAGTAQDANGKRFAFIWDDVLGLRTLGTLGGQESIAVALNNHGQVVGRSDAADGFMHAFVWDDTVGIHDLGTFGSGGSEACAINDRGEILGKMRDRTRVEAVRWRSRDAATASAEMLPRPRMFAMNNNGCVLGVKYWIEDRNDFAFIWREDTGFRKLFPVDDDTGARSLPFINDLNQVICTRMRRRALDRVAGRFLYPPFEDYLLDSNRGWIHLNRYVRAKGGEFFRVCDLNNRGCIIGVLQSVPGPAPHGRAILLEPIPERWGR